MTTPAKLDAWNAMLEALRYWRDECTGHEPSLSVFERHVDEALTKANAVTLPTIVTDPMVDAYLTEQRRVVEEADQFGRPNVGGLHTNTVREACRSGIQAALLANGCEQQEETDAIDVQEDLYWRLHSLSKSLESCDRIDGMENKDAYPTILDAMNLCQKFMDPKRRDEFFCPLCFDKPENIVQPTNF